MIALMIELSEPQFWTMIVAGLGFVALLIAE